MSRSTGTLSRSLFALTIALLMISPTYAATRTVCSSGCDYTSIQDAVDASVSGDTIRLGAETFLGDVFIEHPCPGRYCEDPHSVTICGAGAVRTLVQGAVDVLGVRVILEDMTVQGAVGCALRVEGVVRDCSDCQDPPPSHRGFIELRRAMIQGNECGVEMATFSDTTIMATTIRDNRGNGIQGRGALTVNNSTISGNGGDGIHVRTIGDTRPRVVITQTTINGNSGSGLSGVALYYSLEYPVSFPVGSTIVSDNAAGDCGGLLEVESQGENLASDDTCALEHSTDVSNTPPLLLPLADNGGPTLTHALAPESPAIDSAGSNCEPTDQRGAPRPVDGDGDGAPKCDIGAFEYLPPAMLVGQLIDRVVSLGLRHGIENSLLAKLDTAALILGDLQPNNDHAAANVLGAFIRHVQAQSGKKISTGDADALIEAAREITALAH